MANYCRAVTKSLRGTVGLSAALTGPTLNRGGLTAALHLPSFCPSLCPSFCPAVLKSIFALSSPHLSFSPVTRATTSFNIFYFYEFYVFYVCYLFLKFCSQESCFTSVSDTVFPYTFHIYYVFVQCMYPIKRFFT